eukprot:CAMPEP_0184692126 /NCGR_PEP_ID=MMETSP0313-20130426/732_1 /TAXON_ID=2792 /ORGANISM="Porphyridium aerugineum, Strain SAG 1380-2" /LENGTH=309 /DNA_ID=CAMNT_0027149933 /DNA_START=122 /DNA_END=1051 /DNA_ORIENTATION=-
MFRQKSQRNELTARLGQLSLEIEDLIKENDQMREHQSKLPAAVQFNQRLDKELEDLGYEYDDLLVLAKNVERDRRDLKAKVYNDSNEGTLAVFKEKDKELQNEMKELVDELANLAKVSAENYEIERTLQLQVKEEMIPLPKNFEFLGGYQPKYYDIVPVNIPELYHSLPVYIQLAYPVGLKIKGTPHNPHASDDWMDYNKNNVYDDMKILSTSGPIQQDYNYKQYTGRSRLDREESGDGSGQEELTMKRSDSGNKGSGLSRPVQGISTDMVRKGQQVVPAMSVRQPSADGKKNKWEVKTTGLSRPNTLK